MGVLFFLCFHGLASTNEGTDKFSINLMMFGFREHSNHCTCSTLSDIVQRIASRHLNFNIDESCLMEELPVCFFFQCPRNATSPGLKITANGSRDTSLKNDIGDRETSTWDKNTIG